MAGIIAVTGSTGFIGSRVVEHFRSEGWEIVQLNRADLSLPASELASRLKGVNVLVNLAGSPIAERWTASNRGRILNSRVNTTRSLVKAMQLMQQPPDTFISASAIGIYPDKGVHGEDSKERDSGFMGQVCQAWEEEASAASQLTRLVILRTGVVLDARKGAMAKLLPLFRLGLGGRIGNGRQAFSWIHIDDAVRAIAYIQENSSIQGPVNLTSPQPSTNAIFTSALASALRRPAILPVPGFVLRIMMGQAADIVLRGQAAIPQRLLGAGFTFKYPDLTSALKAIA